MYVPNVDELVLITMHNASLQVAAEAVVDTSSLRMKPVSSVQISGFVAKVDDEAIFLAQGLALEGGYLHVLAVPRAQVVTILRLRRYGTPDALPPDMRIAPPAPMATRSRRGESATVALVADAAEE